MKTLDTIAGKTYVVTSPNGCTVTDETGLTLGTVDAGQQKVFVATGAKMQTDDDSARITATFNSAPAKLKLLGLLGGGSTNTLPAGYLSALFAQNSELGWVDTGLKTYGDTAVECEFVPTVYNWINFYYSSGDPDSPPFMYGSFDYNGAGGRRFTYGYGNNRIVLAGQNGLPGYSSVLGQKYKTAQIGGAFYINAEFAYEMAYDEYETQSTLCFFGSKKNGNRGVKNLQMFRAKVSRAGVKQRDFVPAIDPFGVPCLFDRVSKEPFYFKAFKRVAILIAGMTLSQARKLSKLPATGGTLTISLPEGYEVDEGVANALETARANGWTLTIQTYTPETAIAAASTFALRRIGVRRIWVRKTQDDNGPYESADGTRWKVDWCVDVWGADPQELGYELFLSVDAAVAYWELTPWVAPEAEELLTTDNTND